MATHSLPYLSAQAASDLWERLGDNLDRYVSGSFDEELQAAGAQLTLDIDVDIELLSNLDADASDYENAKLVWSALNTLTPSLARENRIWTCLCHGEGLAYSRSRWLTGKEADGALRKAVELHMFARTLTQCRDDNSLARLWWTAFVAHRIDPEDFEGVLSILLKTADIRTSFVERPWMTTRPAIARGIIRAVRSDDWVTASEKNFRETMKALNLLGAGIAFEVLPDSRIDEVVGSAVEHAKVHLGAST